MASGTMGCNIPIIPTERGFEDYYGFCSGHWGNYHSPMLEHNGQIVKGKGFIIDDFTDMAWLLWRSQQRPSPFSSICLLIPLIRPSRLPRSTGNATGKKPIQMLSDSEDENLDETRAALAMCENIDWNVGRIVEKTRELGIDENTIILYFCDNGPNPLAVERRDEGKEGFGG